MNWRRTLNFLTFKIHLLNILHFSWGAKCLRLTTRMVIWLNINSTCSSSMGLELELLDLDMAAWALGIHWPTTVSVEVTEENAILHILLWRLHMHAEHLHTYKSQQNQTEKQEMGCRKPKICGNYFQNLNKCLRKHIMWLLCLFKKFCSFTKVSTCKI